MRFRLLLLAATAGTFLLLVSIFANAYGFALADHYYRQLNQLRLDPLGDEGYPSEFVPRAESQQVVVMYGDSRVQYWPVPQDLPQFIFVNRGIGGQTAPQVALRFDTDVRPVEPDILVVQVCINDLKTLPVFPEQAQAIIEKCQYYLDSILLHAQEIRAQVILTTIFPVGEPPLERWPVWSDAIAESVNTVNDYIRSLAAQDVIVLDAFALLADERGLLRPELGADELHLNAAGYAVLNEALIPLLQGA